MRGGVCRKACPSFFFAAIPSPASTVARHRFRDETCGDPSGKTIADGCSVLPSHEGCHMLLGTPGLRAAHGVSSTLLGVRYRILSGAYWSQFAFVAPSRTDCAQL